MDSNESIKEIREGIGSDILEAMNGAGDLPLPNVRILAQVMQRYYRDGDHKESLPEKSRWKPTEGYWIAKLDDIRARLRSKQAYFEYDREPGEWVGVWKFVEKKEFSRLMKREYQGISTRGDHFNDKMGDARQKWQLEKIPAIPDIPRLSE